MLQSCVAELSSINIISRDTGLGLSQCQFKETLRQTQLEMQIKAEFMKCSSEEKVNVGVDALSMQGLCVNYSTAQMLNIRKELHAICRDDS